MTRTIAQIRSIHDLALPELVYRAQETHRQNHRSDEVQLCTLLSVKTGGCAEDCSYCPQSSAHDAMDAERFLRVDEVMESARAAKASGATRFCMGAAWREVKEGPAFARVLDRALRRTFSHRTPHLRAGAAQKALAVRETFAARI